MIDQTCASTGCRRPPVQGRKYCEYHLAERTRKARNVLGILGTIGTFAVTIVVGVAKIMSGRKS
jgi:hypothetical protein